jgi:predicted component of viral defense system (DUF524 family)
VIEVAAVDRPPVLLLFDPKYKLESDEQTQTAETEEDVQVPAGQPKKIDIDKMHAYRDAIRTQSDERVVEYAAILYPGPEVLYPLGIEALTADPLRPELLRQRLRTVIAGALG